MTDFPHNAGRVAPPGESRKEFLGNPAARTEPYDDSESLAHGLALEPGTQELVFVVEGPPVPWSRPNFDRRSGRTFNKRELDEYEDLVHCAAAEAMDRVPWPVDETSRFGFIARVYRARNLGDLDNFSKSLWDGLNTCATKKRRKNPGDPVSWNRPKSCCLKGACRGTPWGDDARVEWSVTRKYLDRENPRVEIVIRRLA